MRGACAQLLRYAPAGKRALIMHVAAAFAARKRSHIVEHRGTVLNCDSIAFAVCTRARAKRWGEPTKNGLSCCRYVRASVRSIFDTNA